ncbi:MULTISPECIES: TetR/AcrR family transcriptional regulator [Mycobacteriales]|uniref:TetR/AcrR family transcriptional regulator n=1 Tax=Mycobacteriales TaxID=85007 RepID=UPI00223A9C28|nr:TetR/AcrR family transcriptional regulator [Dietzia cercidiphylli]MCT1515323.1 TetR/AcrR family transcriptional regulator [Dietzia cercidiphylli]
MTQKQGSQRARKEGGERAANQRADAQRNRAAILAATPVALRKNPDASIADIASEAGVGRMTLYGHFKSRAELLDAALVDGLERAEGVLSDVDLDGDPAAALARLIESSWSLLDQVSSLLVVAQKEVPASRIRDMHEKAEARMRALLERGQAEEVFRGDLSVDWLLAVTHAAMNAAAAESTAGRLRPADAPRFINATLAQAFAATA